MSVSHDIEELQQHGVITSDTASAIKEYYAKKSDSSPSKLLVIFTGLGALLIGLGILLILAHNWDNMSNNLRTIIAFLPLLLGQGLVAYTLAKRKENKSWSEGSSAFLTIAIGTCIALIGQIYNLPGDFGSFMLIWSVLALPLVYLLGSSTTAFLYILGITAYVMHQHFTSRHPMSGYLYWILLSGILPFYMAEVAKPLRRNITVVFSYLVPLSLFAAVVSVPFKSDILRGLSCMSLFGIFYLIAYLPELKNQRLLANGYRVLGSLGMGIMLLIYSFKEVWKGISYGQIESGGELAIFLVLFGTGLYLLWRNIREVGTSDLFPSKSIFVIFAVLHLIGISQPIIGTVMINILLLSMAIYTVRKGITEDHLGILNYGLLILVGLLTCRFFDVQISFILRGILFIIVGVAFFIANSYLLKKRKAS